VAGYAIATVGKWSWLLLADAHSAHSSRCHGCPPALIAPALAPGFAPVLEVAIQLAVAVVAIGVCGVLISRWRRGSAARRRALAPVLSVSIGTAVLLAASTGASSVGLHGLGRALEWLWDGGVVLLPFAFLGGLLRTRLRRAEGVARLLDELDALPTPGGLPAALARALEDQSLELAYWLPEGDRYVDADGHPVELPEPACGRAITPLDLDGRRVAVLIHDVALSEEVELVRAAGRTAVLWLERARLEAERNARIVELRQSRARIVAASDAERRRIERDLHDGAQQRLAALLLQARLGRRTLIQPDGTTDGLLTELEHGLAEALAELRRLAAGILPPVLADHGLAAAIEELAGRSPIPVSVEHVVRDRLPRQVESAAYFVVAEALANEIKHAHASRAAVRAVCDHGRLFVDVSDDGIGGATQGSGLQRLADRVGAVDGTLTWSSPVGGGTVLHTEIPCAS
jgi:signal transduction histidine kinase